MRTAMLLMSLLCCAGLSAGNPRMYVYRNDGGFDRVELADGTELVHHIGAGRSVLVAGGTEVPLDAVDSCAVRTVDVPAVRIRLTDYPDVTQLWDKELYLDATIEIDGNGYVDDLAATKVSVKGRGNSTWSMPKKPYRLKCGKKTAIGGLKKAKSYAILANYIDPSLMRNAVALTIAARLGMPFTNSFVPCEVWLNGHAQGAYLLTEKIGIAGASVDIDEETGVLLEMSTEFDEAFRFRSPEYQLPVMVKDPDFEELYEDDPSGPTPDERLAVWRDDFTAAEKAVSEGRAFEAFDLDAFVNCLLVNDICGNSEVGWPKSVYLYKERAGDDCLYRFGPVWDFDAAFNVADADRTPASPEKPLWLNGMFARMAEHPQFKAAYRARLEYFAAEILPEIYAFIDSYAALVEPSAKLNGLQWPAAHAGWTWAESSFDAAAHADALRQWLAARMDFLLRGTY